MSNAVEVGRTGFRKAEVGRLRAILASDLVIAMTSARLRRDVDATIVDAEQKASRPDRIAAPEEPPEPVDAVLEECRGLLAGILMRSKGFDNGGCRVADCLVEEISARARITWNGITVPGEEDRTTYATGVIGLKFPGPSLWSLPFAAHEFAHILAQTWHHIPPGGGSSTRPLAAVLQTVGAFPRQREELWCDFFATFVLGPAYTFALLLRLTDLSGPESRFEDPVAELATHPSDLIRLRFSLRTLEKMDSTGGRGQAPYAQAIRLFRDLFPQDAPGPSDALLTYVFGRFWTIANDHFLACRLVMSSDVDALVRQFKGRIPLAPVGAPSVRDVVSAAWLVRIDGWEAGRDDERELEQRALWHFSQIIDRPNDGHGPTEAPDGRR